MKHYIVEFTFTKDLFAETGEEAEEKAGVELDEELDRYSVGSLADSVVVREVL